MKAAKVKLAQVSTASMGRFDRALAGEPARPKDPRKQVRLPNEIPLDREKTRQSDILRKVLHGSGEGEGAAPGGVASGAGDGSGGGKFRGGKKHRK